VGFNMRTPLEHYISSVLSPAVLELRNALLDPAGGLLVYWGPFSSGKTTSLKDLAVSMQDEGRIVKYIDAKGFAFSQSSTFSAFFKTRIGMLAEAADPLSYLPHSEYAVIIIIDHLEDVMMLQDTKAVLMSLTRSSSSTKTFKVLVTVSPLSYARSILYWNGGTMIRLAGSPGCGQWKMDQIRALASKTPHLQALTPTEREATIRLGAIAGTPTKFLEIAFMATDDKLRSTVAQASQQLWAEGVAAVGRAPSANELLGICPA
jgi:hypothetical protein